MNYPTNFGTSPDLRHSVSYLVNSTSFIFSNFDFRVITEKTVNFAILNLVWFRNFKYNYGCRNPDDSAGFRFQRWTLEEPHPVPRGTLGAYKVTSVKGTHRIYRW